MNRESRSPGRPPRPGEAGLRSGVMTIPRFHRDPRWFVPQAVTQNGWACKDKSPERRRRAHGGAELLVWLTTRKGVGSEGVLRVLEYFGTPERVYFR